MLDNCCVPLCHKSGYRVGPDGKKITYHDLPLRNPKRLRVFDKKKPIIVFIGLFDGRCKQIPFPNHLQTWLVEIRRDISKDFKLTKRTKICSLHFKDLDFRLTLKGRR